MVQTTVRRVRHTPARPSRSAGMPPLPCSAPSTAGTTAVPPVTETGSPQPRLISKWSMRSPDSASAVTFIRACRPGSTSTARNEKPV